MVFVGQDLAICSSPYALLDGVSGVDKPGLATCLLELCVLVTVLLGLCVDYFLQDTYLFLQEVGFVW